MKTGPNQEGPRSVARPAASPAGRPAGPGRPVRGTPASRRMVPGAAQTPTDPDRLLPATARTAGSRMDPCVRLRVIARRRSEAPGARHARGIRPEAPGGPRPPRPASDRRTVEYPVARLRRRIGVRRRRMARTGRSALRAEAVDRSTRRARPPRAAADRRAVADHPTEADRHTAADHRTAADRHSAADQRTAADRRSRVRITARRTVHGGAPDRRTPRSPVPGPGQGSRPIHGRALTRRSRRPTCWDRMRS
jgi:hypothetical protein